MSLMRLLPNNLNEILNGTLVASSTKPAANAVFPGQPTRQGNGSFGLNGSNTNDEAFTLDLKVSSSSGSTISISNSSFAGVGNGVIANIIASGLSNQVITIELISRGTITTFASTSFYGVDLVALVSGPGGDSIYLDVDADASTIVRTSTNFSTFEDINKGQTELEGNEWDYGDDFAKELNQDDEVNLSTKRISFGHFDQVHKMYKIFDPDLGDYKFYLTPAPERAIPKGSIVKEVTGAQTVLVSNGTTTETYSAVTTLYSFLTQIVSTPSALIEVDGVVAQDLTRLGMATLEFALRTHPYFYPIVFAGSDPVKEIIQDELNIVLQDAQETEDVEIKCINNSLVGGELWQIKGVVSGLRDDLATTGTRFIDPELNRVAFTIPTKEVAADAEIPKFRVKQKFLVARDSAFDEEELEICVEPLLLGPAAVEGEISLVYREKSTFPEGCDNCDSAPLGGTSDSGTCLGIIDTITEGGDIVEKVIKERMWQLYNWKQNFIEDNTGALGDVQGEKDESSDEAMEGIINKYTAVLQYDRVDIEVAEKITGLFHDVLHKLILASWSDPAYHQTSTAYVVGDLVRARTAPPAGTNNRWYKCTVPGITDASEPVWTMDWVDETDGTVTWEDLGPLPLDTWDDLFTAMQADLAVIDDQDGGDFWKMHTNHISTITETDLSGWVTGAAHDIGDIIIPSGVYVDFWRFTLVCTAIFGDGETGASEPVWANFGFGQTIADNAIGGEPPVNGVIWTKTKYVPPDDLFKKGSDEAITFFLKQYQSDMQVVLVSGGIEPPFQGADTGTTRVDQCWRDCGTDSFYWEVQGGDYLYACTNQMYYSVKEYFNEVTEETEIIPTDEFGFAVRVNPDCIQYLKEGDRIVLEISGVPKAYEVDDTITVSAVNAAERYLTGGVTGDNTLTWRVLGTVTGTFSDYALNTVTLNSYYDSGGGWFLGFDITPGGIPFKLGDIFTFAIESGKFIWRKDSGAWSSEFDITDGQAITDGLSLDVQPGTTPSFVVDDLFPFTVNQRNAPSHLKTPTFPYWEWDNPGDSYTEAYTMRATFASAKRIDTICLYHEIEDEDAVIQVEFSNDDFASIEEIIVLTWRETLIVSNVNLASITASSIRLRITTNESGRVIWWWAGTALKFDKDPDKLDINDLFLMNRGDQNTTLASFYGKVSGGSIAWENWLSPTDMTNLQTMLTYVKTNNEQPIIFVPNENYPEESSAVVVTEDRVPYKDFFNFHTASNANRKLSVDLTLEGVLIK